MTDSNEILLEFKAVVAHFDITPRTLRYYEYLELISPIREGRKRFYTKREMARLTLILAGRRFGFKLEEIRQMLEMYDPQSNNEKQTAIWIEAAERQLVELTERRAELDGIIDELVELKQVAQRHLDNFDSK